MIVPRGSPTLLAGGRMVRRPARGFRFGPRRGTGWGRGLGYVSPVGFQDFASFQTAVIASFPACPPPFDPTCENPRDAQIASNLEEWHTNPQSCGVIVCNAAGNPAQASPVPVPARSSIVMPVQRRPSSPAAPPATAAPAVAPKPFGYWAGGATPPPSGGTVVIPAGYSARPIPIQSASPAAAPGGSAAPPAAPIPVQTQTPPCDPSSDPNCPGYQAPPTAPTAANVFASIPWWGWGIGVVALILITRPGGRR